MMLWLCSTATEMSNPNTPVFPGAAAADTDLYVATDGAQTVLNGAMTAIQTTVALNSASRFVAPCLMSIGAEIIICPTAAVGDTFSGVTRGAQGSTAAAHPDAAVVSGFFAAWHHNQIAAEIKAIETQLVANGVRFIDAETPGGAVDGANTTFTLAHAPSPAGSLRLYRNGLLQARAVDYTLAGLTITALSIPQAGDTLLAFYRY